MHPAHATHEWPNDVTMKPYVIIDDVVPDNFKIECAGSWKLWLDHLPFSGKILYQSGTTMRPRLILTSNYSPEQLFCSWPKCDYDAIMNRINPRAVTRSQP